VFFKRGNGTFRGIDAVVVRWDQLDVYLIGLDVLLNCVGAPSLVHHIQCWLVIVTTEYRKHLGQGSNEQVVGAGWHWCHDDCVKVIDVCDKDTSHVLE
jgi:hypothetical protein